MDIIKRNEKESRLQLKAIRKAKDEASTIINKHTELLRFLERQEKVIVDGLQLKEDMDRKLKYNLESLNDEMPIDQVPDDE